VDVVVATYKDMLTGFGFKYLEYFSEQYGVYLDVASWENPKMLAENL